MDLVWTALVLGLVGSLHCAGMCGPLALALPVVGTSRLSFTAGRLLYNAGRITTYAVFGIAFGMLGQSLALAGLQRWVSLVAGVLVLGGLAVSQRRNTTVFAWNAIGWLKRSFAAVLARRTFGSLFLLGMLNGLLPCGLVYVAAAGATATGAVLPGVIYMIAFGIGTLPVMLGLGLAARQFQLRFRFRMQRLIPVSVACLGILLVLRGMALGIPYLSPDLGASPAAAACH